MKFSELNKRLCEKLNLNESEYDSFYDDLNRYEAGEAKAEERYNQIEAGADLHKVNVAEQNAVCKDILDMMHERGDDQFDHDKYPHLDAKFIIDDGYIKLEFKVDGQVTDNEYDWTCFGVPEDLNSIIFNDWVENHYDPEDGYNDDQAYMDWLDNVLEYQDELYPLEDEIETWIDTDEAGKAYAEKYLNR